MTQYPRKQWQHPHIIHGVCAPFFMGMITGPLVLGILEIAGVSVHYALWVDLVRQEEYDRAYEETLRFKRSLLFWDPLLKVASLGMLGRIEEGFQAGKDLLACKPDFQKRGRVLIQHYIKFDEIIEKAITGLGRVGIEVE